MLMPIAPLLTAPYGYGGGGSGGGVELGGGEAVLDLSDMRRFLTTPTPRAAGTVCCYIERDRSGLAGRMYPTYCLYLEGSHRFLLAARKRGSNKTSNYIVSMDKRDLNRESASYLGKLRSNFVGTEFTVYDDGEAADKVKPGGPALRQELGVVAYASNVLGSRGPRKMKVAVPKVGADGRRVVFQAEKYVLMSLASCDCTANTPLPTPTHRTHRTPAGRRTAWRKSSGRGTRGTWCRW